MAVVNNSGYSLHYATAGDVQTGMMKVLGFTWTGATATHTMTFKDGAGNIWAGPFTMGASLQPIVVMFPQGMWVDGLEVDVLGSGVVDVFLG